MAQYDVIAAMGATQFAVGLSAIVKVSPSAFQRSHQMKIVSGAGTLWISPIPFSLTGQAAASLMAIGYPVGATEIISANGPATFYLAAAGATMVVGMTLGYTSGVSMSA